MCVLFLAWITHGQIGVLSDKEPQQVFAGEGRQIIIALKNAGEQTVEIKARAGLIQTTSATAVRLGEVPWKTLRVLSGQTVLESVALDFPEVRAETRFVVQWIEEPKRVFGRTAVLVHPMDLLKELKPLTGDAEGALGVFDPMNQIKPLLKNAKVDFADLEESGLEGFRGKLAILGPFESKAQMREDLSRRIETVSRKGVAIVWIQPPPAPGTREKLVPSYHTVSEWAGAVIVAQPGLVERLSEKPQSQLNLIQLCRQALDPVPLRLPQTTTQP